MHDQRGTLGEEAEGAPAPVVVDQGVAFGTPLRKGLLVDGKYRLGDPLGAGGMGVVYRARDERLQRDVAVKVVRAGFTRASDAEGFLAEARAMARVRHPNVVDVYDFGSIDDCPYLVMEFIEGGDLEGFLIDRSSLLAVDEALGLFDQICRGVAAIHASGAVHRDLKPGNIIIGFDFRVAVADLGLAELLTAAGEEGSWVGTPGFIAPDLLRGERPTSELLPRLDIYALGSIAYELLTGQPAFTGPTVNALLDAQRRGEFRPLVELRPELPADFDEVIAKALSLRAEDRHASADELKRALHAARRAFTAKPRGRRIVVIDDQPADAKLVKRVLESAFPEIKIESHSDPHAALQAIGTDPPALIVTDLRMPRMDGLQLVQSVRMAAGFNHVPIVVLTAEGGARDWRKLRESGADGFSVKPIDPVSLRALVDSLLESPMRVRGASNDE